jgi:addiction module HigA family antidote
MISNAASNWLDNNLKNNYYYHQGDKMKKETPGTVLNALLKKHGLNYSSLAKAIGLSGAMVRLIALDENPVSAAVAFRLAAFFKTRPEYWLDLQAAFDIARTAKDKKLAKALKGITTVDKVKKPAKKGRKAKAKKPAKKTRTAKGAKKTAGRRGRPAAARKAKPVKAVKKTTGRRGRPAAKKTTGKRGRPAAKKTAGKRGRPAAKKAAGRRGRPAAASSSVVNQSAGTVNEPNI